MARWHGSWWSAPGWRGSGRRWPSAGPATRSRCSSATPPRCPPDPDAALRVGPAGRPAGAPQPRLPRPAPQPAARPPPRRARGAARGRAPPSSASPRACPTRSRTGRPRPGDEDLVALACRRTTFEWVLRKAALASPGVSLLDGVVVDGLAATDDPSGLRRVTGVHLADGRTVDGDLVVLAGGRRGDVPAWFEAIGAATVDEDDEDTGIVYWSRFYRLTGEAPVTDGPDRRRPRLPQVRGVPGRQRHVLGHPRHAERGRHAAGALRRPSGSTRRPPRCSRSRRGSRPG